MSYNSDIARLREVLDEVLGGDSSKNSSGGFGSGFGGGKIALAFSHQIEDTIALDLTLKAGINRANLEVFTLDTKKLFDESLAYQAEVARFFDIEIKAFSAEDSAIITLENELGEWGMRESVEKRKHCCAVRKITPLKVALSGKVAWISGIRIAQSITRAQTKLIENDANFALKKINPLFDWEDSKMWDYAKSANLPINALYSQGFSSIGCNVCTRAIKEGEDIRAGRWWWENPDHKECGLHRK
ncbi:phosphoadenylyl-sulfate reductase [Helicobacter sp. 23-1044]